MQEYLYLTEHQNSAVVHSCLYESETKFERSTWPAGDETRLVNEIQLNVTPATNILALQRLLECRAEDQLSRLISMISPFIKINS